MYEIYYNSCNLDEAVAFALGAMMTAYKTSIRIQVGLKFCRFTKQQFKDLLQDEWESYNKTNPINPTPKVYSVTDDDLLITMD